MKLVILGGGESGVGTAILGKKEGYDVFLSDMGMIKDKYKEELDKRGIAYEEGKHTEELLLDASEVVKSPGIPDTAPLVKRYLEMGTSVVSEIEFASRYTSAKKVCITGSNGKTTTTMLAYYLLKNAGLNVGLAGNVGKSFAWQVAEEEFDYYVLELSSFQLDGMFKFKAEVAVILNITPDHLDRYDYKFQNYIDSKFRILQNQTPEDAFIFWSEDPILKKEIEKRGLIQKLFPFALEDKTQTAYLENNNIMVRSTGETLLMPLDILNIKGQHNVYNTMAAAIAAQLMDIKKEDIRSSLEAFQGVEHRLEYVASVRGVKYINDSKATNVNSCWYALQSMTTPTVLILGGVDKGNDYSEIKDLVEEKVHTLILLGTDNSKLVKYFGENTSVNMFSVDSMAKAIAVAYEVGKKGDTVLLSPCCASFDLFKSYEDRGEQFKKGVKKL